MIERKITTFPRQALHGAKAKYFWLAAKTFKGLVEVFNSYTLAQITAGYFNTQTQQIPITARYYNGGSTQIPITARYYNVTVGVSGT